MYFNYLNISKDSDSLKLALSSLGLEETFNYNIGEYDILCSSYKYSLYYRDRYEEELFNSLKWQLEKNKPKAFIFQNFHWLYKYTSELEDLGYSVYYEYINAENLGFPSKINYFFVTGFDKNKNKNNRKFKFPSSNPRTKRKIQDLGFTDISQIITFNFFNFLKRNMKPMRLNKGEWSEFFAFLKIIAHPNINFGNENLEVLDIHDYVTVYELQHIGSEKSYILDNGVLKVVDGIKKIVLGNIEDIVSNEVIDTIKKTITNARSRTFDINQPELLKLLGIQSFKGDSNTKADINVSHMYESRNISFDPWGIKSFLGNPPTLLNAGTTTNFVYELVNFNGDMNSINSISTKSKIKDRLKAIYASGSSLNFSHCENEIFHENLRKTDSLMPEYLSDILIKYYSGQGSKLTELVDTDVIKIRIIDFLKAVLLGMFLSKPWDGNYASKGLLIVRSKGDLLLYHVIKDNELKDYLFKNTRLDTASSTRHQFGSIYQERSGKYYFKLNLQIRNK